MNLSDIITKCYILALIIRDDGERLLLGDGFYEFKENLQHFQPNTFVNDVVELQGTDGQLLAGQVRRTAVQTFEGFIADGTIGREQTETNRRRFLQFFRKKHFYTVVYILPDGSAVQRDRGYIVNAPSVPELYQRFPEYSVGLNFEDPNYYEYDEGEDGEEIPAHSVVLSIANLLEGGLIWDAFGAVSNEKTWLDWENGTTTDGFYTYNNGLAGAPLNFEQLDGNATQKTLSGWNILNTATGTATRNNTEMSITSEGIRLRNTGTTSFACYGVDGTLRSVNYASYQSWNSWTLPAGTYTMSYFFIRGNTNTTDTGGDFLHIQLNGRPVGDTGLFNTAYGAIPVTQTNATKTFTITEATEVVANVYLYAANKTIDITFNMMLEAGSTPHSYEPYVGGMPSPSPDFPQIVNTVTGLQTIKITGKNIFDKDSVSPINAYVASDGSIGYSAPDRLVVVPVMPNTTYTITAERIGQISGQYTDDFAGAVFTSDTPPAVGSVGRRVFWGAQTNPTLNQTFTTSATENWLAIKVANVQRSDYAGTLATIQLEINDQATPFEPYMSTSAEINLGKNLLNASSIIQGTWNNPSSSNTCVFFMPIIAGETYTISNQDTTTYRFSTGISTTGTNSPAGTATQDSGWQTGTSYTITAQTTGFLLVQFRLNSSADITPSDIPTDVYQIEGGSQATSYAPYKTPIELAGVGPIQSDGLPKYHDSFKRVDGVWYKHTAIGKAIYNGAEDGWATQNDVFVRNVADASQGAYNDEILVISDHFIGRPTCYRGDIGDGKCAKIVGNNQQIGLKYSALNNDVDAWKTWLGTHNTTVYYALATSTDTVITDADLLAQLNAIASTYDGVNNITITPSAGAQGELSVHYATGSIDVGAGYEWEEGSDTGTNIIVNNGIDSVNPTWIVPGPATNPTLTNITTGQTIVWEGSVASGQTLTVDLNRQTAELGGTNVFAQLSGDWVKLAPGPNKLAYSATGATEGCRLEWNGVVG